MKKSYMVGLVVAAVALLAPTLVFAIESNGIDEQDYEIMDLINEETDPTLGTISLNESPDDTSRYLSIRGKWGQGKDQDADGFFGGRLTRNGRVVVFNGMFNKTNDEGKNRIVCIMKNGYFNGKIISDEGEQKITGLYSIDRENKVFKLQWMVSGNVGWAVGRVIIPSV
ncbi:MAG: hypothetical protein V1769_00800 [Thermoplasmatota archaeon]